MLVTVKRGKFLGTSNELSASQERVTSRNCVGAVCHTTSQCFNVLCSGWVFFVVVNNEVKIVKYESTLTTHNVISPFQAAFLNVRHPFLPRPNPSLSHFRPSTHSLWLSESDLMNRITEFNPLTYFRLVISCNDNILTSCCIGLTLNSREEPQNQNVKVL